MDSLAPFWFLGVTVSVSVFRVCYRGLCLFSCEEITAKDEGVGDARVGVSPSLSGLDLGGRIGWSLHNEV